MKKQRVNNIKVVKSQESPETPEVLATSLVKIGEAMEKLTKMPGGLNNDGISALVCNMKGMSQLKKNDVLIVLDGLSRLKSYYIRKTPSSN